MGSCNITSCSLYQHCPHGFDEANRTHQDFSVPKPVISFTAMSLHPNSALFPFANSKAADCWGNNICFESSSFQVRITELSPWGGNPSYIFLPPDLSISFGHEKAKLGKLFQCFVDVSFQDRSHSI